MNDPAIRSVGSGADAWVLLAGVVGSVGGFHSLEEALLPEGHRVVTIDPFELSMDSSDVTFAAMARRVMTVLDGMGVTTIHLVGHSNGAGVALRMAAMAPDRVQALYFLDAGALSDNQGTVLNGSVRIVPLLIHLPFVRAYLHGKLVSGIRDNMGQREWFDKSKQHAYIDPMLDEIKRVVRLALRLHSATEPETIALTLSKVRAPVVVILGDAPHPSSPEPRELTALAALGPRVRVVHLPGVGHFPHEEATSLVALQLLQRESGAVAKMNR